MNFKENKSYQNTVHIVKSMIETHRKLATNGNNTLIFKVENKFPEEIFVSGTILKRIVNNIITNALKHTSNGEITVTISKNSSSNIPNLSEYLSEVNLINVGSEIISDSD